MYAEGGVLSMNPLNLLSVHLSGSEVARDCSEITVTLVLNIERLEMG